MSAPPTSGGPRTLAFQWLGRIPFADGLAVQLDLADKIRRRVIGDTIVLAEHDPVYTIGRTRDRSSLAAASRLPHPVVEISRGGQATFHGPGQLVGYPILNLEERGRDLHRYLRALESALVATCARFGLAARPRDGLTGVWVGSRKLASIGVGVRHWVSLHGFALNVTAECLAGFRSIVPCGIAGVEMTCLAREAGSDIAVADVAAAVQSPLESALDALVRAP
jgi:lipoyl(octanoyl) transferase